MMQELYQSLLRKAACGFLVQGIIHNMSGPLQILSMQVELMSTTLEGLSEIPAEEVVKILEEQYQKVSQIADQVERLRSLLAAITEITEDSPTMLDLNELVRREIIFWEGDLVFKHEVQKDLKLSPGPLLVYASPAAANQGLCCLFWGFVPTLSKGRGRLEIITEGKDEGPRAIVNLKGVELSPDNPFLGLACEFLSPYATLDLATDTIILQFRKK